MPVRCVGSYHPGIRNSGPELGAWRPVDCGTMTAVRHTDGFPDLCLLPNCADRDCLTGLCRCLLTVCGRSGQILLPPCCHKDQGPTASLAIRPLTCTSW